MASAGGAVPVLLLSGIPSFVIEITAISYENHLTTGIPRS